MSKPQDRVTRSVLNYWSPQGAYPLLRFFAYTRKYILKDQPHSRRVSAPPGECQWDEKIASTNSRKSSCRYAQILDLATLLACFEAGEPIFSFGVFFSSSWKLITKLNFTFYLDSLPCSLHLEWKDQMKRRLTKNGRFIFQVFLILVCLLIHLLPIGIFLLKIQIMDTGERASWWASWR